MNESPETADIVIAGGGIVGSATAYFLSASAELKGQRIVLVDRDLSFAEASTARSAGGLRQQFSTPENIALSQATLGMIRHLGEMFGPGVDIGWREQGYLLLASAEGEATLADNVALQSQAGADVALMRPADLVAQFPWLSTEAVRAGAFGRSGEGWFDPPSFAALFRDAAKRNGVAVVQNDIVDIERGARVEAVRLVGGRRLTCGTLVNAAGAWSGYLAAMAGVALPVEPRKRYVYVIDARETPDGLRRAPLVVDPSGVWFRPEGRFFICGKSPEEAEEPSIGDLGTIDYDFFDQQVWPVLAARVQTFASVKVVNAWAGYYDYNALDQNAVIGAHPELTNFYLACGFSGHGAQQGPAAARAVAELIAHGRYQTIDLTRFDYSRIAEGRPLYERNVI
jgi:glycine/D-amino acid oxidase-like deaminating enzyme